MVATSAPVPASVDVESCGHCGHVSPDLLVCLGCHTARYCSADHQLQAWFVWVVLSAILNVFFFFRVRPGHKKACRQAARKAAAASVAHDEEEKTTLAVTSQPAEVLAIEAAPTAATVALSCVFCGDNSKKLLLCGKCKVVRYCGAEHQKQHWWGNVSFIFSTRLNCLCQQEHT